MKQLIKKLLTILILLISLFYLVGCVQKVSEPTPTVTTTPTTEEKVADIKSDVSDVGTLDEDLNLKDLENIDKELENVTW